jgi:hypothetical protein
MFVLNYSEGLRDKIFETEFIAALVDELRDRGVRTNRRLSVEIVTAQYLKICRGFSRQGLIDSEVIAGPLYALDDRQDNGSAIKIVACTGYLY